MHSVGGDKSHVIISCCSMSLNVMSSVWKKTYKQVLEMDARYCKRFKLKNSPLYFTSNTSLYNH